MCNRKARDNKHDIQDCFQIVEVSLREGGNLEFTKGTGKKPLNLSVKGAHTHQMYTELVDCITNGDGGTDVVKEFERLEGEGATPCQECGDVFPTHLLDRCPNHPYAKVGDQGFKLVYAARAVSALEQLKAVADRMAGRETKDTACLLCTESNVNHNWRSSLKRMKCRKNKDGHWETEPPGDAQEVPMGYHNSACENCIRVVPDHPPDDCSSPELSNFGARFAIARGEDLISQI